jgi:hypothetical protein
MELLEFIHGGTMTSVQEIVRHFLAERGRFTADELAEALRSAGHTELAQRLAEDPSLLTAIVTDYA